VNPKFIQKVAKRHIHAKLMAVVYDLLMTTKFTDVCLGSSNADDCGVFCD
jgi:hypothetical protein